MQRISHFEAAARPLASRVIRALALSILVLGVTSVLALSASAHCDGLDGPVVGAARKAFDTGDVTVVLVWVKRQDEVAIRDAFAKTLAVRTLGPEARELADRYFFETVVRLHRAGEGAPYTGLKPAGRDLGPAIPAADAAIKGASTEALERLLVNELRAGLTERFKRVLETKDYAPGDVEAGRRHVEAYVAFIHYVERLYEAADQEAHGHFDEDRPESH